MRFIQYVLIPSPIRLQKNVGTTPKGVAPTFRLLCVCNYKICICSDASNSAWISLLGS